MRARRFNKKILNSSNHTIEFLDNSNLIHANEYYARNPLGIRQNLGCKRQALYVNEDASQDLRDYLTRKRIRCNLLLDVSVNG